MKTMLIAVAVAIVSFGVGQASVERRAGQAQVFTSPSGTQLRVLVDARSLGGSEVEVGELTFPPNSDSSDRYHGVTETFYALEGQLEQVINGKAITLTPGMVASLRSTDQVRHKAGPNGAKALVIWAPGGEIARVTARWRNQ